MRRIIISLMVLLISSSVCASEGIVHGGFIPDYKHWQTGYFVTDSHVDGKTVKGAYIKSKKQEVKLQEGTHKLKVSHAFKDKPKRMTVGETEIIVTVKNSVNIILPQEKIFQTSTK